MATDGLDIAGHDYIFQKGKHVNEGVKRRSRLHSGEIRGVLHLKGHL